MADIIKVLPGSVANQIAAGEVVQRPASVVKELLENAIDAGADSVAINIREGGKELVHISDNGKGISPADSLKAFERHATSKISSAEDLYRLATFGFRGEALASIASVAEVELRTKQHGDDLGTRVIINGGVLAEQSAVNTPQGTQFFVKNLFYNIPARRKFLKSNSVELKYIIAEFIRVALCNPGVEMVLNNNDSCVYNLPASGLRQRIVAIAGKHTNQQLFDLSVDTSIINITGFIGSPQFARKSCPDQYFFVNGRYFRSPYFHKAVMTAYEKLMQPELQPPYFLYFTVDPSRLDVNISPSKTEVKFEDEQAIWQIINAAVRESLGKLGAVPMMDFENETPLDIPVYESGRDFREPVDHLNPDFNPFNEDAPQSHSRPAKTQNYLRSMSYTSEIPEGWEALYKDDYDSFDKSSVEGESFRDFINGDQEAQEFISAGFEEAKDDAVQQKLEIGGGMDSVEFVMLSNRYAVTVYEKNLTVVDLPRAHHRVLYESYLNRISGRENISQQELFPQPVPVSRKEAQLFRDYKDELSGIGFDVDIDDAENITLWSVPAEMDIASGEGAVHMLLEAMELENVSDEGARRRGIADKMAQSAALTSSRPMTDREIERLLLDLFACSEPAYTPTGKPVMAFFAENEIEKRFK